MDAAAQLSEYEQAALAAIAAATDADSVEAARIEFLGKKQGRLKDLQKLLGQVTAEERPVIGKQFNEVKNRVNSALEARQSELLKPSAEVEGIDVTLPGAPLRLGKRHPLTQTIDDFKSIMARLGFASVDGPEIEDEHHNFEALNIPAIHPARDPLDNFYLATAEMSSGGPLLLRSQTSTVQIRVMEQTPPPVRIVSLGRVYRPDTIDATHSCMFHQMEGLWVEEGVTLAHLKSVLRAFMTAYLGDDVHIRFRPSFFPFTEPSVEADMSWHDDWLEIGGAGMVDPNVLKAVGYDPEKVTGFAFGLGVERFCMRRHGITDIRRFYENDVRFLQQF
ncbi:MAG: phenylalanine--tRNA ligase subunit alpha [Planctomycetaceae bacterium]|nr:phenylalanine--tRNA ligase subunit alpha [Planctomycetaceae bacterium]MCA9110012.1 phenylalanine--tRNA ligase subunit alpha [Planctomycetaceae bacterium]